MPNQNLRNGRYSINGQEYFITFCVQNRKPLFNEFEISRTAIKEILDLNNEAIWLAWVLMPDHFHGVLRLESNNLSSVIRKIKSKSAIQVNKKLNRNGRLWQSTYYDRALRKEEDRKEIARYIIANPLRAGLVKNIKDYPYWDCVWL